MAWIRHLSLDADTVETIVLPERKFTTIEVLNVSGEGSVYFLVLRERDAAIDPTVGGNDCEVLPATMCGMEVDAPDDTPLTIKMISGNSGDVSVRAE